MGSNAKKDTPFGRADFLRLAEEQYGDRPEYLWRTSPHNAVLRHPENRKWYAVLMQVSREKLGLAGAGPVDIVDLKCDPALAGSLRLAPGILPGYHMHKGNWITLVLDGSVEEETVRFLLDRSHSLTAQGAGTKPPAGGRTWLIPANPKYYDVEAAFAAQDTIRLEAEQPGGRGGHHLSLRGRPGLCHSLPVQSGRGGHPLPPYRGTCQAGAG